MDDSIITKDFFYYFKEKETFKKESSIDRSTRRNEDA